MYSVDVGGNRHRAITRTAILFHKNIFEASNIFELLAVVTCKINAIIFY